MGQKKGNGIAMSEKVSDSFLRLFDVVKTLCSEGGCPWDMDQTPLSMRQYLIEETFEACDAIASEDFSHVREELGDVMLNCLMTSFMYEKQGKFSVSEVFDDVSEKLVRRHPHVFKNSTGKSEMTETVTSSNQVMNQWDRIKSNVEGRKTVSVLDEVPSGFPPMLKAYKMLKKAAKKGFEWRNAEEARNKVDEEWAEVLDAVNNVKLHKNKSDDKAYTVSGGSKQLNDAQSHLEEEIGDLLLSVINYGRLMDVDPMSALSRAVKKFYSRFTYVEREMDCSGETMDSDHIDKMIELWKQSKKQ